MRQAGIWCCLTSRLLVFIYYAKRPARLFVRDENRHLVNLNVGLPDNNQVPCSANGQLTAQRTHGAAMASAQL